MQFKVISTDTTNSPLITSTQTVPTHHIHAITPNHYPVFIHQRHLHQLRHICFPGTCSRIVYKYIPSSSKLSNSL